MELHFRSLAGRDSLPLILLAEWEKGGPHTSKLLKSTVTNYLSTLPLSNIRKEVELERFKRLERFERRFAYANRLYTPS
jgi:hypothetical protein